VAAAVKNLSPNGEQRTELPSQAAIDEAVRAQKDGKTRTLLWLTCVDFADTQAAWNEPGRQIYAFSGDGLPAPPPEVDPQDLAIRAQEIMVIPEPVVERNPKIDAQGSGTLVGLPTWFWVTNPESVGGPDGTKTIRAEVIGTPVFAEVVAHTNGLTLSSPAGGTSCPPGVAATAYTAGASDTSGCHVEFARASVAYAAGYPVTAATTWSATWTGRTQAGANVGGALNGLARATTVDVPVAETQALVHGMR
jgi:hypothetical protein